MAELTASRRSSGTEFLKECIADALIRLMENKTYEKITVQEITDCANVGRATYFRQFTSKEDVLMYKIRLLWRRWAKTHHIDKTHIYSVENLTTFFEFIYSIRSINSVLVKSEKMNVLIIALSTEFGINDSTDPAERYRFCFITFGLAGVLTEWIKHGYKESPQDMIKFLSESSFN